MKLHSIVLFVKDIELSKTFYTKLIGLSVVHDFGNNVILSGGISIWQIQQSHIISQKLETASNSNRFELYFEAENLDEINIKLEQNSVKFLHRLS